MFRKLNCEEILPLSVRVNDEIDHPPSDFSISEDDRSYSDQCVYDASGDEVGLKSM